jgi:arsenate reductase
MTIICYPRCTTCKRAVAYLDQSGIAYEYRDIKVDNPTAEELADLWKKSGLPLRRFFNTSGQLYRQLELKDRLPSMSEKEMLDLLATDGMLVKRPILVSGQGVLVGFKEAEWEKMLKG